MTEQQVIDEVLRGKHPILAGMRLSYAAFETIKDYYGGKTYDSDVAREIDDEYLNIYVRNRLPS